MADLSKQALYVGLKLAAIKNMVSSVSSDGVYVAKVNNAEIQELISKIGQ